MRGGNRKIYIETNLNYETRMPYFELITDENLSKISDSDLDFLPESFPVQFMKYIVSKDKKIIYFRFCTPGGYRDLIPPSNELSSIIQTRLDKYLQNPGNNQYISKGLKKLNLQKVRILLYIPYINTDTREIEYTEYIVLNYKLEEIQRIEKIRRK